MALQPLVNDVQHRSEFGQHLPVIETQHRESKRLQLRAATCIVAQTFGLEVLPAIDLDDKPGFDTSEVSDERADLMLSAELAATESSVSER
jgi:hypothetical protein